MSIWFAFGALSYELGDSPGVNARLIMDRCTKTFLIFFANGNGVSLETRFFLHLCPWFSLCS